VFDWWFFGNDFKFFGGDDIFSEIHSIKSVGFLPFSCHALSLRWSIWLNSPFKWGINVIYRCGDWIHWVCQHVALGWNYQITVFVYLHTVYCGGLNSGFHVHILFEHVLSCWKWTKFNGNEGVEARLVHIQRRECKHINCCIIGYVEAI